MISLLRPGGHLAIVDFTSQHDCPNRIDQVNTHFLNKIQPILMDFPRKFIFFPEFRNHEYFLAKITRFLLVFPGNLTVFGQLSQRFYRFWFANDGVWLNPDQPKFLRDASNGLETAW
jgi:hypothetical protein